MVSGLLSRGLLRGHARQNLVLFSAFAVSFLGLLALAMISSGGEQALTEPLRDTITGDLRITEGGTEVTQGTLWPDVRNVTDELDPPRGTVVAPRFESNYVTVRGSQVQNWSAGLLLGMDGSLASERAGLEDHLVQGAIFEGMDATDPETGEVYAPLVVGRHVAERLGATFTDDGSPTFNETLTLSSGRTPGERGGLRFPIAIDAVIVGVYETGLEPVDKFIAFAPIQWVRQVEGHAPGDPVANALVVHGEGTKPLANQADEQGLESTTPRDYALNYLGGMMVIVLALTTLQLVLYTGLLMIWLGYEVHRRIQGEREHIAALRAIGIPGKLMRRAYVVSVLAIVGAAAAVALIGGLLLGWLAPPLSVTLSGVSARIPWNLNLWPFLVVAVGVSLAALVVTRQATRGLERVDIREGLQSG